MRIAIPLVVLIVACAPPRRGDQDRRGDDKEPADAGIDVIACTSDAACEALGLVCDLAAGRCVCTRDAMCDADSARPWCLRGTCSAAQCVSEVDCDDGLKCLGDPARCITGLDTCDACSGDADCKSGASCREQPGQEGGGKHCVPACGGGCAFGFSCQDGACFPASGTCDAPGTNCVPDSEALCLPPQYGCGDGNACDLFFGQCFATHTICEEGWVCDPNTYSCVTACEGDDECDAGQRCASGRCVAAGVVKPACQSNEECPLGERCVQDPLTALISCVPGCSADSDCGLASVCASGQCRSRSPINGAQHCQVKEVCGFREHCTDQVCKEDAKHCQPCGGGCGAGGQCSRVYFSITCGDGAGLLCPDGSIMKCGLQTGSCSACACEISRCLHGCSTDPDCPKGFYCANYGTGGSVCAPVDASQCL